MKNILLLSALLISSISVHGKECPLEKFDDLKKCNKGDILTYSKHERVAKGIIGGACDFTKTISTPSENSVFCVYTGKILKIRK